MGMGAAKKSANSTNPGSGGRVTPGKKEILDRQAAARAAKSAVIAAKLAARQERIQQARLLAEGKKPLFKGVVSKKATTTVAAVPATVYALPDESIIERIRSTRPRWPLLLRGEPGEYFVGMEAVPSNGQPHGELVECFKTRGRTENMYVLRIKYREVWVPLAWVFYPDDANLRVIPGPKVQEQMRIVHLVRAAMPDEIKAEKRRYATARAIAAVVETTIQSVADTALRNDVVAFARSEVAAHEQDTVTSAPLKLQHQLALNGCKHLCKLLRGTPGNYLFRESDTKEGGRDYDMVVELVRHQYGPKLQIVYMDPMHTVASYLDPRGNFYQTGSMIGLHLMHVNHRELFEYMAESVFVATHVRMRSIVIPRSTASVSAEIAAARTVAKGGVDSVIVAPGHEKPNRAMV